MAASTALLVLVATLLGARAFATPSALVTSTVDVFASGISQLPWSAGERACYRIPSLLRLSNGTLIALVAERLIGAGGCSDESPSNIVLRRSHDGGATWGAASLVLAAGANHLERSAWALEDASSGAVYVFSNSNVSSATGCSCGVEVAVSKDRGGSFAPARPLPESSVYGSGLASGITHSSGRLVGCMRKVCRNSCAADYHSRAFFSDDHGETWASSAFLGAGSTECQIAELSDGRLYMTIRPYKGWTGAPNVRLASYSSDAGSTWSAPQAVPQLVDWGFADEGSVTSDPASGVLYFVHPDSHARANLSLWRSTDDGRSWDAPVNVYPYSAAYSDSAVLDPKSAGGEGKRVGVLFEEDNNGDATAISFTTVEYE